MRNSARQIPMKRCGPPAVVAGAMLYLASDDAASVTGQSIVGDRSRGGVAQWAVGRVV